MLNTISLRPNNFDDFIGQEKVVNTIKIVIESSKIQNKILDHIIFYGPPGRGKTTLANIISHYTARNINFVQGALLVQKSDILTVFANINENDIIFIDEIHSINKNLEELIYSVMEDNVIDIPIGPDGEKRILRMKVKPFTLLGATTQFDKISKPIRDRFGLTFKLDNYSLDDIAKIIVRSAKLLTSEISFEQALIVANYCQESPRVANRLTKRIVDFAQYYNQGLITNDIIFKTLKHLSIYKGGLQDAHIEYLRILLDVFEQKNVALDVLISLLNQSKSFIINDIEPILLAKKLIIKTSRGRQITTNGVEYLLQHNLNPFKL